MARERHEESEGDGCETSAIARGCAPGGYGTVVCLWLGVSDFAAHRTRWERRNDRLFLGLPSPGRPKEATHIQRNLYISHYSDGLVYCMPLLMNTAQNAEFSGNVMFAPIRFIHRNISISDVPGVVFRISTSTLPHCR